MKLSMIMVALLSLLGNCGRFIIDNMVVKGHVWTQVGLPYTGTSCRIWVKHGSSGAISRLGLDDAPAPGFTRRQNLHYFDFPSSQTVSTQTSTYLWTSCADALLIDFMQLQALDGTKTWGSDNAYAWCLSTDVSDATDFNNESQQRRLDWNVIPAGICYSTLRLNPSGPIWGWHSWRPTHWETRRMLEEMEEANVPSAADVDACVDDESRPAAECDDLVDQILSFEIEHEDNFYRAVQLPIDDSDLPDIDVGNTQAATDDRRVLNAVKRLLKA